ncbi:MoaD/ThiS family protein [Methanogenium cariaci]|uniref:MoaD/ThiS family protein n=1 Tax=Methanogenium cariaci TaxID=2197 RepID=UPI001FDF5260|nr:MoaD/ThiS family protein [Methanogenium cariaci]
MKVTVKTFATLRRFMERESHMDVEPGITMGEFLEMLTAAHPPGLKHELFDETGELRKYVNILKNGRNIHFINELGGRSLKKMT